MPRFCGVEMAVIGLLRSGDFGGTLGDNSDGKSISTSLYLEVHCYTVSDVERFGLRYCCPS